MPTENLELSPGNVLVGRVQGVTNFGAFVELAPNVVGLVHISEIADTYVKDIKDFVKEGDEVKVKILSVDGRKIALSIKQAAPPAAVQQRPARPQQRPARTDSFSGPRTGFNRGREITPPSAREKNADDGIINLDDKIARFLKESEERMQPLKNRYEHKKKNRY